jgi:high-affinity nickel permease
MPLQKLVGNIYSVFVEILLWLMPITGIVAGVIAAKEFRMFNSFVGVIFGLVVGLLLDVICFGPVIILMNMRSSLKNIENK